MVNKSLLSTSKYNFPGLYIYIIRALTPINQDNVADSYGENIINEIGNIYVHELYKYKINVYSVI